MHDTLRRIDAYLQTPSDLITDEDEAFALEWARALRNTPTTRIAVDLISLQKETNAIRYRQSLTEDEGKILRKEAGMQLVLEARNTIRYNNNLISMLSLLKDDEQARKDKHWTLKDLRERLDNLEAENTYLEQFNHQPAQKSV